MLTAKRFIDRATATTRERLEAAASNARPIGLRETHRGGVRAIQSALADISESYLLQAQVDGNFGARTAAAVETFQRDYGLYADGFVGRQTMTQLDLLFSSDVVRKPVGISVNVGVNVLDTKHYGNEVAELASCRNDAQAMLTLAERLGYIGSTLADEDATVSNVTAAIRSAADALFAGDVFLYYFSGHGSQIPNTSSDDEPDGMDETTCLYDRMLIDDELHSLLGLFRSGVRIFVVFDSCHSATAAKAKQLKSSRKGFKDARVAALKGSLEQFEVDVLTVPVTQRGLDDKDSPGSLSAQPLSKEQLDAALAGELNTDDLKPTPVTRISANSAKAFDLFADIAADLASGPSKLLEPWEAPYKGDNRALYDTVRNVVGPKEMIDLNAKVVSLAACLDTQTTLAGSVLSEFTSNIMSVWGEGTYDDDSEQLIARLREIGSYNGAVPTLTTYGVGAESVAREHPFVI